MRIVYTETALRDLANVYEYQQLNWPTVTSRFNVRLAAIERYIGEFPRGAPKPRAERMYVRSLWLLSLSSLL
jgi:plasmid stabilization system protein ParE